MINSQSRLDFPALSSQIKGVEVQVNNSPLANEPINYLHFNVSGVSKVHSRKEIKEAIDGAFKHDSQVQRWNQDYFGNFLLRNPG